MSDHNPSRLDADVAFTEEEKRLARALYVSLQKASANSWMQDSPDDAEEPHGLVVDGRFNFPLVARCLRMHLAKKGESIVP
jgi:hypothetical protein